MIYFKIDGVDLDIPKDLELSFQKKNILFSFDDIELNRSQGFTLPRSQTNDAIFQFSFRPDFDGAVTRVTHFAEMFYSGGKEDGILSCSSANDNGYECVFIFGELRNLRKIKEAGKISGYFDLLHSLEWSDETAAAPANDDEINSYLCAMLKYKTDAPESVWQHGINVLPSVRLDRLIDVCCSSLSVGVDITFPEIHPRIILSSTLGKGTEVLIDYEKTAVFGSNNSAEIALSPAIDGAEVADLTFQCFDVYYIPIIIFVKTTIRTKGIRFNRKMEVTFKSPTAISTNKYPVWFLDPGDVVSFDEGDYFTFINRTSEIHYFDEKPYMYGGSLVYGGFSGFTYPESGTFGVRQLDNISYNMTYRLNDNLPDVTLIDLLKTYAHIYNRLLFYDPEANRISFFDGNFTNTPISLDDRIIKRTGVKRTIGTFAQKNKVVCDSEDYVLDVNKYNFFYNISNETIEKEKTIINIPFSEGNILSEGSVQYVKLSDLEYTAGDENTDGEWNVVAKTPTIAIAGDQPYMTRIRQLAPANDINEIFEISTTLNIKVQMYLFEFQQIKPKDVFLVGGIRYAYFSATWNKNIANLVLIKIK